LGIIYDQNVKTTFYHYLDARSPVATTLARLRTIEIEKEEQKASLDRLMKPRQSPIELAREAEQRRSKALNESQQSLFANPKYANAKRSEWITIPG